MAISKEQSIIEFYGKWQRLSDTIRTGWRHHARREEAKSHSIHPDK